MTFGPTTRIGLLLRSYPELEDILEYYDVELEPAHEMLSVRAFCKVHDIDPGDLMAEFRAAIEDDGDSWIDEDDEGDDDFDFDDDEDDDAAADDSFFDDWEDDGDDEDLDQDFEEVA